MVTEIDEFRSESEGAPELVCQGGTPDVPGEPQDERVVDGGAVDDHSIGSYPPTEGEPNWSSHLRCACMSLGLPRKWEATGQAAAPLPGPGRRTRSSHTRARFFETRTPTCSVDGIGVMADLKTLYAERDEDDPTFVQPKRPPKTQDAVAAVVEARALRSPRGCPTYEATPPVQPRRAGDSEPPNLADSSARPPRP